MRQRIHKIVVHDRKAPTHKEIDSWEDIINGKTPDEHGHYVAYPSWYPERKREEARIAQARKDADAAYGARP